MVNLRLLLSSKLLSACFRSRVTLLTNALLSKLRLAALSIISGSIKTPVLIYRRLDVIRYSVSSVNGSSYGRSCR